MILPTIAILSDRRRSPHVRSYALTGPRATPIAGRSVREMFRPEGRRVNRRAHPRLPQALPLQLGELLEHPPNAFAPFFAEGREVHIPLIETPPHVQLQAIPFVTHEINR